METLEQIWLRLKEQGHETDKGSIHSYLPVYEKLLAPYRESALNVLEIGIFKGASIRMWSEYFTKAIIQGIDCSLTPHDGMANLEPLIRETGAGSKLANVNIHIFNAEDGEEVNKRFNGLKFDVIVEDAGHNKEQQQILYSIFKHYLTKKGIYIIEDIQDIDYNKRDFENIDNKKKIDLIDLRHIKNRYDDVLVVIK